MSRQLESFEKRASQGLSQGSNNRGQCGLFPDNAPRCSKLPWLLFSRSKTGQNTAKRMAFMKVLLVGALCLPLGLMAQDVESDDHYHDVDGLLMPRQETTALPCRLNYTTDVWTGCDDVLAQFGISLDQFRLANPSIGPACDQFVPGKTYCVAACESALEG